MDLEESNKMARKSLIFYGNFQHMNAYSVGSWADIILNYWILSWPDTGDYRWDELLARAYTEFKNVLKSLPGAWTAGHITQLNSFQTYLSRSPTPCTRIVVNATDCLIQLMFTLRHRSKDAQMVWNNWNGAFCTTTRPHSIVHFV